MIEQWMIDFFGLHIATAIGVLSLVFGSLGFLCLFALAWAVCVRYFER